MLPRLLWNRLGNKKNHSLPLWGTLRQTPCENALWGWQKKRTGGIWLSHVNWRGWKLRRGETQQLLQMLQTFEEFTAEFAQDVAAWEAGEMGASLRYTCVGAGLHTT